MEVMLLLQFLEISDKVFAFDSEMEYLSNINTDSENKIERVSLQRLIRLEENIKNHTQKIITELDKGLMLQILKVWN